MKYNAKINENGKKAIDTLQAIIMEKVIKSRENQSIVFGGALILMQLFDALKANPRSLLPKAIFKIDNSSIERKISDYIAGMTDNYAHRLHERIYGDYPRSVFEKL